MNFTTYFISSAIRALASTAVLTKCRCGFGIPQLMKLSHLVLQRRFNLISAIHYLFFTANW